MTATSPTTPSPDEIARGHAEGVLIAAKLYPAQRHHQSAHMA